MSFYDLVKQVYSKPKVKLEDAVKPVTYAGLVKASSPIVPYSRHHRGQWFRPEYDFKTLAIAQHSDGLILRTIKKKADRLLVSGYSFVGINEEPVDYVKNRVKQMEIVSGKPFPLLLRETADDLLRQANSMWVKVRDRRSSSGNLRIDLTGRELEPVAAYYILPFSDLEFKAKLNGELKKVKQKTIAGEEREHSPVDIIHFYTDLKAGFLVGTPELLPALEDVSLLRRIEELVEELIETNLFPSYHYKIGTETMPERVTPEGESESQIVKKRIEYMPAGSIHVTDHRHEITAIGSQGKALAIESYLDYFRKRAISSIGGTEVDLGIEGGANRSTANQLSQSMLMDVEALMRTIEVFINNFVINELLLEGGYDPFDVETEVKLQFGVVDIEKRIAKENQQIQMFTSNLRNLNEVRAEVGDKPVNEEWFETSFYKLFEEPLALIRTSAAPGSTASEVLAGLNVSNVTPQAAAASKAFATKLAKTPTTGTTSTRGRKPASGASSSAKRTSAGRARPSNQSGTRSAPKLSKDVNLLLTEKIDNLGVSLTQDEFDSYCRLINTRWELVKELGVSLSVVVDNVTSRLK